jgi:hypothetical protein
VTLHSLARAQGDSQLAKALRKGCVVHVQRKSGHLGYGQDPTGIRNLLAHWLPAGRAGAAAPLPVWAVPSSDIVACFSGDPAVLAFARHLCSPVVSGGDGLIGSDRAAALSEEELQDEAFNTKALYACLASGRPEALPLCVELHHLPRALAARSAPFAAWLPPAQLRLALAYYGETRPSHPPRPRADFLI